MDVPPCYLCGRRFRKGKDCFGACYTCQRWVCQYHMGIAYPYPGNDPEQKGLWVMDCTRCDPRNPPYVVDKMAVYDKNPAPTGWVAPADDGRRSSRYLLATHLL